MVFRIAAVGWVHVSAPGTFVELGRDDPRWRAAPANINIEFAADSGCCNGQIGEPDSLLQERCLRAAGHNPFATGGVGFVPMTRDTGCDHFETDELPRKTVGFLLVERRL